MKWTKHTSAARHDSKAITKRGQGTEKTPVAGIVERGGEVRTQVVKKSESMNFKTLKRVFDNNVVKIKSAFITDEYKGYMPMAGNGVAHAVVQIRRQCNTHKYD